MISQGGGSAALGTRGEMSQSGVFTALGTSDSELEYEDYELDDEDLESVR